MSRTGTPIVLDNWLSLLSKLNTETGVVGRELANLRGKRYSPDVFTSLRDFDIIQSGHMGYRLCQPLTRVPFSALVDLWSPPGKSYTRQLFLRYGHLSVEEVNALPALPLTASNYSFDGVMNIIHALRCDDFVGANEFYPSRKCSIGYMRMIAHQLCLLGLVINRSKDGYRLLKCHSEIRIKDIAPAVSTKCHTLSKILLLAQDVPVSRFFR